MAQGESFDDQTSKLDESYWIRVVEESLLVEVRRVGRRHPPELRIFSDRKFSVFRELRAYVGVGDNASEAAAGDELATLRSAVQRIQRGACAE